MRRLAASLLAGVALIAATAAWAAFAARHTVLDAGRSERIAAAVADDPVIRDVAADALSRALRAALPPQALVSTVEVEAIARQALDDPRAEAALRAAVVSAHQRLVGQSAGPVQLDATPVAEAGRDALLAAHPEIARFLPAAPPLAVELPTEDLPTLGWAPDRARRVSETGALAGAGLLAAALLIASDRPRVLRRAGHWAVGAGIAWALLGWLLPYGVAHSNFPNLAVLGALATAIAGSMVAPAGALVAAGAGAVFGAGRWETARATAQQQPRPGSYGTPPPRFALDRR